MRMKVEETKASADALARNICPSIPDDVQDNPYAKIASGDKTPE